MEQVSVHYALLVSSNGLVIFHVIQTVLLDIIKTRLRDFVNNVILHAYIVTVHMQKTVHNVKVIRRINIYC